jgi:hypothetical protein
MPYDGDLLLYEAPNPLMDTIIDLRIVPVSPQVLDAHKIDEIEKHPASYLVRHFKTYRTLMLDCFEVGGLMLVGGFLFFLVGAVTEVEPITSIGIIVILGGFVCFILPLLGDFIWVKTEAFWKEDVRYDSLPEVPASIAQIAHQIKDRTPGSYFVIGTLWQDSVRLDPYLLVRRTVAGTNGLPVHNQVIVGIWDGDTVIAVAKPMEGSRCEGY